MIELTLDRILFACTSDLGLPYPQVRSWQLLNCVVLANGIGRVRELDCIGRRVDVAILRLGFRGFRVQVH